LYDPCIEPGTRYNLKTSSMAIPTSRMPHHTAYGRATTLSSLKWTRSQTPWRNQPAATGFYTGLLGWETFDPTVSTSTLWWVTVGS
jgi:hypothetical protein